MSYIPPVVVRPKVPVHQLSVSEGKLDKKGDKKQSSTAPEPDLDGEVTDDKGLLVQFCFQIIGDCVVLGKNDL